MKNLTLVLAVAAIACSKPPKEEPAKAPPVSTVLKKSAKRTVATMAESPALLQFHFSHSTGLENVKKALSRELGFMVDILWSQFRAFEQLDLWILPPEGRGTEDFEKLRIAACVRGTGKSYVYLMLRDETGAPLREQKDTYVTWKSDRVQGPKAFVLFDDGKRLCLASDKALLVQARKWKRPPVQDPDDFLTAHLNLPILFSRQVLGDDAEGITRKILNLRADQKDNIRRVATLIRDLRLISLGVGIDKDLNLKLTMPLYFRNKATFPQDFVSQSGARSLRPESGEALDLSLEMKDGLLWGIDLAPPGGDQKSDRIRKDVLEQLKLITHLDIRFVVARSGLGVPRARLVTRDGKRFLGAIEALRKVIEARKAVPVKIAGKGDTLSLTWDFKKPLDEAQKTHAKSFGVRGRWSIQRRGDTFTLNGDALKVDAASPAPHSMVGLRLFTLGRFGARLNSATELDRLFARADTEGELPVTLRLDTHPTLRRMDLRFSLPVGSWIRLLEKNPAIADHLKTQWQQRMQPAPSDL